MWTTDLTMLAISSLTILAKVLFAAVPGLKDQSNVKGVLSHPSMDKKRQQQEQP